MMYTRVWLGIVLGCLGVTARYLPTPELVEDFLLPFTNVQQPHRVARSVEGSGDNGFSPIMPLPGGLDKYMERLEMEPKDAGRELDEEGSGAEAEPVPYAAAVTDDVFAKEEGMDVLKDLSEQEGLPTEDDNRQGNSLSVLASEDRPETPPDEEDIHRSTLEEEGSGDPGPESYINFRNATLIGEEEKTEAVSNEKDEITSPEEEDDNKTVVETEEFTTKSSSDEIAPIGEIKSEEENAITTEHEKTSHEVQESGESGINPQRGASATETSQLESTTIAEVPEQELTATSDESDVSFTEMVTIHKEEPMEASTEAASTLHGLEARETTAIDTEFKQGTEDKQSSEVINHNVTEVPTDAVQITSELSSTEISSTSSDVEVLSADGVIMMASAKEAPAADTTLEKDRVAESSIPQSISTSIIIGVLAVAFIALIVFVTFRNRRKRQIRKIENSSDPDTEKSLLSNGKFKSDSEDIKNNEISPLVINKFEKSPNFSSQKNLNTTANDKNIEKDNVLKQAMIEDEVEEAKKAIVADNGAILHAENVEDDKKPEKVVVRTHIDLDSIPRKPLIITKNGGHSYESVPTGESET